MDKVRLAVIGAGNQCTNQLMPAIPFIPEIDLVAVCDLKRDLAERNARAFGALAAYTDFAQMLDEQSPDAAMVVGPPQMHEEIGIAALEHGCHLFVEKPCSPTVEGAKRLMEAGTGAGRIGQVGHMMRHADPIRVAWDLVHSEEFGAVLSVESKYCTWPGGVIPPGHGWGEPDADWTYMLNQGGHPIDLLRHFLGPIVRVAGAKRSGRGNAKVYQAVVESSDGRVGFLNCQDSFRGWMTGLEVVGDGEGVVRVDDLGRVQYRRGETRTPAENGIWGLSAYVWEPHHMLKAWQRSGYGNQLRRFAQCILEAARPVPNLWDGWRNLVVGECLAESCRTHRTVEVPQE
jgi:phthalate 4,5-cis-dihydrodiol dehydrogenase